METLDLRLRVAMSEKRTRPSSEELDDKEAKIIASLESDDIPPTEASGAPNEESMRLDGVPSGD